MEQWKHYHSNARLPPDFMTGRLMASRNVRSADRLTLFASWIGMIYRMCASSDLLPLRLVWTQSQHGWELTCSRGRFYRWYRRWMSRKRGLSRNCLLNGQSVLQQWRAGQDSHHCGATFADWIRTRWAIGFRSLESSREKSNETGHET